MQTAQKDSYLYLKSNWKTLSIGNFIRKFRLKSNDELNHEFKAAIGYAISADSPSRFATWAKQVKNDGFKCLEDIGVENALRTVEEKEAIQATKHQYKLFIYEDLTRDMKRKREKASDSTGESSKKTKAHELHDDDSEANPTPLQDDNETVDQNEGQYVTEDDDLDDLLPSSTTNNNATAEDFRQLVFKAGYHQFKEMCPAETIAELNRMSLHLQPTTLGEWLDHFSHYLVGSGTSEPQKHALKLSLSRILYLVGGPSSSIFESFFTNKENAKVKFEEAKASKVTVGPGMNDAMRTAFRETVEHTKLGKVQARIFVGRKKLELLEGGIEDSELLQLLDVLDHVLAGFRTDGQLKTAASSDMSELSYYRRFAVILDTIFRDTSLDLIDGERTSKATKAVREMNMKRYNDQDDKQNVIGRKIDLLIGGSNIELSSSEWKKENVSPSQGILQQIKNARTNKSILKRIERLPLDPEAKEELFVLGMDWIGSVGYMVSVHGFDGAFITRHVGDLRLPLILGTFGDFENTLDLLFAFKHHQIKLQNAVTSACQREHANKILQMYREPTTPDRSPSPDTFFTPVKRKTARSLINREALSDQYM